MGEAKRRKAAGYVPRLRSQPASQPVLTSYIVALGVLLITVPLAAILTFAPWS